MNGWPGHTLLFILKYCKMNKGALLLFFFVYGYILYGQESQFKVVDFYQQEPDKQCKNINYYEKINDSISYLLVQYIPVSWKNDTMRETYIFYKLKWNKLLERKIVFDSCRKKMICHKIGDMYLFAGIDYNYKNRYQYAFTSYVFNQNFDLIKDTAIVLDDQGFYCHYDNWITCYTGTYPVIYPKGDTTYLFTNLSYDGKSAKLFSVKYDTSLDVVFSKEGAWRKSFLGIEEDFIESPVSVVKQPGRDTLVLSFGPDLIGIGYNFNELFWWDVPRQRFRISLMGSLVYTPLEDSILVFGHSFDYNSATGQLYDCIAIGKNNLNWRFNFSDSVRLKTYQTYFTVGVGGGDHADIPSNNLIKLDDGNYIGIFAYRNTVLGDTNISRIIITKFTPELRVLCQQTYIYKHFLISLKYVSLKNEGNRFYVSGWYDKINEYGIRSNEYPFVTYFDTDCNLPGATPIEDYLGLSNKAIQRNVYGIQLYPNPTSSYLQLSTVTPLHDPQAQIHLYDMMGSKLRTVPWKVEDAYIDMQDIPPGVYICTVSTAAGVVFAKSFVKQ